MSDEEDGEENDSATDGADKGQGGRKFKRRVGISKKNGRRPPRGLPSAFLNSNFSGGVGTGAQNDALEASLLKTVQYLLNK
ncbi:hypothetical protein GYMLUDRAFT_251080 [Collybiopsis luxurians FD-317 M1]|uniref:Uncharacterized protein n=1 Tax=Collybiopsis luxurians FD-317 M1 TaxID=944289 RepID=A0A0D0C445_9AGAR|nr:hypothetical protein GYMLUDRAFT_251080 [Collybiopsis luxurians FD-317 M1]